MRKFTINLNIVDRYGLVKDKLFSWEYFPWNNCQRVRCIIAAKKIARKFSKCPGFNIKYVDNMVDKSEWFREYIKIGN